MVEERGYEARVRVQAGAALPGVSADSFGAGVGQAIGQAGQIIQQEQLETARIDRDLRDNAEWSAFLVADAQRREAISTAARDGRLSDAPGHAERIGAEVTKAEEELVGMLTSDRLKQQARGRIAEWGGSLRTREADYEFLRGQEIMVERFEEQRGIAEGRVRRLEKPDDYRLELKMQLDGIATLNTSDEIKQKLIDETEQRFAVSFIRGMTDRDPAAAQALIDSGAFDGVITGDQVEVLRGGAQVEIRRVQAQQEREQSEALAEIRGQIQTFEQAEGMGLVQDDSAYDQAIAGAQAIGDDQLVLKLTGLKANNQFTKIWGPENANPLQREQRMTELAGKDTRSPDEILELEFLRKNAGGWAAEEARDPVGQAARRGGTGAPPVVDFANPASIAARGQWAATRSAQGRRVPAFTAIEAQELNRLYDSGRQGEEQVMAVLEALPPAQAMESAKQIDPNDLALPIVATLGPVARSMSRRGREALRANKNFLYDQLVADDNLDAAFTQGRTEMEQALRNVPPEQRNAIFITAKQIAAGHVDKYGGSLTADQWTVSVQLAVGGKLGPDGWAGGLAKWGDASYRLPEGVTSKGFSAAITRDVAGSQDPPVNPDGSLANLFRLAPVEVAEGLYEFRNAGGDAVKRKSGKVYQTRVRPR